MGLVYQRVKFSAVHEEELTILVDTGATYSLISPGLADRLGAARFPGRFPVTLADGRQLEADMAMVKVEIGDRAGATTAIIAECPEPLLGVEALEVLGLAVDPTTGTVKPTRPYGARLGAIIASSAL